MQEPDLTYVVCPTPEQLGGVEPVEGSEYRYCEECGSEVVIGPIGIEKLNDNPLAQLHCQPCAQQTIINNPDDTHDVQILGNNPVINDFFAGWLGADF